MASDHTSIVMGREEISHLADRLNNRAASRLMDASPELRSDLRIAAVVLRAATAIGFPISALSIGADGAVAPAAKRTITPCPICGGGRSGSLKNITAEEIAAVLGFPPNVADDPDKVTSSWSFDCDGRAGAIWDYCGSTQRDEFSTCGDDALFVELFGAKYTADARPTSTRRVLGHGFAPMEPGDRDAYAGAEPGSLICHTDDLTLILSPSGDEIAAIDADGDQVTWRAER